MATDEPEMETDSTDDGRPSLANGGVVRQAAVGQEE